MKKWQTMVLAIVSVAMGMADSGWAAGPKVAVLDMGRLIKAHPEAREADALLKKQADEFEAEQKELIGGLEKLKKEFDVAREEASDKALSDTARQQKMRVAEQKYADLREQEKLAREKLLTRQQQLSDMRKRMRDGIEEKIREAAAKYARDNGYTLVLDRSGRDPRGSDLVVFSLDNMDITEAIGQLLKIDKKDLQKDDKKD